METKELIITPPEGYEIDKESSTFERVIFKKKEVKRWRDGEKNIVDGYFLAGHKVIQVHEISYTPSNYNVFATNKQAKSALAMAKISQIMANDERFGWPITDEEWKEVTIDKFCIGRSGKNYDTALLHHTYHFLAFHTRDQRSLFLGENEDLVKDYLML